MKLGAIAVAVSMSAALLVLLLNAEARPESILAQKSLTRTEDVVILRGADLPKLTGRHKDRVRAFAWKDGALAAIPCQIDERTRDGTFCWTYGEPQICDEDNGIFDQDDELCFMARDAGGRADMRALPPECDGWQEVELEDPLTNAKGWVYVLKFNGTPPAPSPVRYVSFSRNDEGVCVWRGERFLTSNAKTPENAVRATVIQFAPPGSNDPKNSPSVIDCSKVTLKAHWTLFTVERNSADVRISIGGWVAGPVRIVAQNIVEVKLAWGIWLSAPDSTIELYANSSRMPTNVKLPVSLNESDESFYKLPIDLSTRAKGWKFYNDKNPDPVDIDGRMDARETKLDTRFPSWNCAYGPEGAIITRFVLDPRTVRPTNKLFYLDDLTQEMEPEYEPGSWGTFGYYVDLSGLKSGLYSGDYIIFYCAAPFAKGDEKKLIATLDHPLKRTIR